MPTFNVPLELIAYSFPSHAPIYIVPSPLTAGEEYTSEPTKYTHLILPSGLRAKSFLFLPPTYIVPSAPIAGVL